MTSGQWKSVKEAFHHALALPEAERHEYLTSLDAGLRREVESLLLHDPGDFLEKPAAEYAVELLCDEPAPAQIGAYRILRELGRGGMATVYLAERADGQFQKRVAIKILHGGIVSPELKTRFLQERQLLADLDHPNIVRLLDGNVTEDGRPFLIEDHIEGSPITRFAAERALGLDDRLRLFLPVVNALEYAHGLGIIHRDLKPGNILAATDGTVKLVDFGIAQIGAGESGFAFDYWTPSYASPEQARREALDPASDIYSMGAVLYELLTGRLLEAEPDYSGLPAPIRTILRSCLSKQPRQRMTATEVRIALERHLRRASTHFARGAVLAAVLIVSVTLYVAHSRRPAAGRFRNIPVATEPSFEYEPVLSPDGTNVVYAWNEGDTTRGINLYRKPVEGGRPQRLTYANARDALPQYSPDGKELLFSRSTRTRVEILRLDLATGSERIISAFDSVVEARQRSIRWATWLAGGSGVALIRRLSPTGPYAVFVANRDGGGMRQVTFPGPNDTGDQQCAASPDGSYLAFTRRFAQNADIFLVPVNGGQQRRLTHDNGAKFGLNWSPDAKVIYFGGRIESPRYSIYRIGVHGDSNPEPIAGLEGSATWPSVAFHGRRLRVAYVRDETTVNIYRWNAPWRLGDHKALCPSTLFDSGVNVSPRGDKVAYSSTRGGKLQIWVCEMGTGTASIVSDARDPDATSPRFSPDGTRVAYTVTDGNTTYLAIADLRTMQVRHYRHNGWKEGRPSFSGDGRFLYFRSDRDGAPRIWKMALDGDGSSAVPVTGRYAYEAIESPGGQWLYFAKERAMPGIFRTTVNGGEEQLVVPRVREGLWGVAADGLYWIRQEAGVPVERLRWGAAAVERIAAIPPDNAAVWSGFSVSLEGRSLYWSQTTRQSVDVMVVEGLR